MNKEDAIVWEAWGALENFAKTNPAAPPYLRDMVKEYQRRLKAAKRARVPYPEHCVQPEKCAGLNCCPRDPVCID